MLLLILFIIAFLYIGIILFFNIRYPELRWNWSSINVSDLKFPKGFIWGTATASHQVEGDCNNNNWYQWENSVNNKGEPCITRNQKSGIACDHWNRFDEDIELIKELGVKSYRLSLEWSKIEPTQGSYDKDVINHYHTIIDALLDKNIKPVITLHHFTDPIWFHELGAFENKVNNEIFINYSKMIFTEFSSKVKTWCTINEPSVYTTLGYFVGLFPPGKNNLQLTSTVLKNLLEAHTSLYHILKKMPNGQNVKIGIVKNIVQFDPYRRYSLIDWIIAHVNNYFYNSLVINFFKNGKFKIRIPGLVWINHSNKDAIGAMDFFGLNYYSHNHVKFKFSLKEFFELKFFEEDIMTDMPYTIYAEGFYRALKLSSTLKKPIIVTENGIADAVDDRRKKYIERYLYALSVAISEGIDVKGYYYWSLMDNFEWAFGYDMKFGLYEVDFETQKRTLREGSKIYKKIVESNS